MVKKLLTCLLLFSVYTAYCKHTHKKTRYAARFGEHTARMHAPEENIVRIFLDKDGNYYPEIYINDKSLKKDNSSLAEWYSHHIGTFNSLCSVYGVSAGTFQKRMEALNNSIANTLVSQINNKSKGYDIVNIYVHGFSKKAYGFRIVDRLASGDNKKLEDMMTSTTNKKLFFVEVYWDANFISVLHAAVHKKGYHIFKEEGIPNALHVGLALRKVVPYIHCGHINIISHSVGAVVTCGLLFNADKSNPAGQERDKVPGQPDIRVCMVAPATCSHAFADYFHRGTQTINPEADNYSISVVYNLNDIILNKNMHFLFFNIGGGTAESIAPTTLGCQLRDLQLLQSRLAPEKLQLYDLSYKHGKPRACHYLTHCYLHNKYGFTPVIEDLER